VQATTLKRRRHWRGDFERQALWFNSRWGVYNRELRSSAGCWVFMVMAFVSSVASRYWVQLPRIYHAGRLKIGKNRLIQSIRYVRI
jgi:hypothetical protein